MDPRVEKLADLMVRYSNQVKAGEKVLIGGTPVAQSLLLALYQKCLEVGAYPFLDVDLPGASEIYFKTARKKQLEHIPKWRMEQAGEIDCLFRVLADINTRSLNGVDPQKQQTRMIGLKPYRELLHARMADNSLRWCLTLFPTEAYAQDADMSLREFEDFVYRACKLHEKDPVAAWTKVKQQQDKMVDFLNQAKKIRIQGKETDLSFSVRGRKWINCCGTENMPDGEVFTGPVEESVNGKILFSFPACRDGREVQDVCLKFKDGQVVEAHASKNEEFLHKMLDLDSGSRYVGEYSFATNYHIQKFIKEILFDEKIGGTIHLALGSSYPESGGVNKSVLHWDMICDLRQGGKVMVDGKVFLKDGKIVGV